MHEITINDNIDKNKWNTFINNEIYFRYEWFYIIKDTYGLNPYFIMISDNDKFALIATFKINDKYVSLPYLNFAGYKFNDLALLQELKSYFKENNMMVDSRDLIEEESTYGYVNPIVNFNSFDEFWNNISSNTRTQFRKSEKNNFIFKENDSIDVFYSLYQLSMRNLGTPSHKKDFFKQIQKYMNTIVLTIYDENKAIGSMFCIYDVNIFFIAYAATLTEYNSQYANYFLYLNALKFMDKKGLTILDMGRTTYGIGTFDFKKKFKPKFYKIESSKEYNLSKSMNLASNIWKKLPLSVANILGPKVRKYLI